MALSVLTLIIRAHNSGDGSSKENPVAVARRVRV